MGIKNLNSPEMSSQSKVNIFLWLGFSTALFIFLILSGLLLIILLNGGWVNHVRTPVINYFSLFPLFWVEEPVAALEFIATKSIILFAHHDAKSDLNLWTLEYDAVSLFVYLMSAIFSGWLITQHSTIEKKRLIKPLAGAGILVFAFTYMTAIDHCAGATWVGFVSLYGLGVSGFDIYPYYQTVFAGIGISLIVWGMYRLQITK